MSGRRRTLQEWVHWLELGGGARWTLRGVVVALTLWVSGVVGNKQFHGPVSEVTLLQAGVGRQLASGQGFTTLVNYPQTDAFMAARGVPFDPVRAYPEIGQAPLYAFTIGGVLRAFPQGLRDSLFAKPPVPPDGFAADYLLLALNIALFWAAQWLTFDLARRLFGLGAAWLASLGLLFSVPVWQQTVAVNGTALMMVVALVAFHCWWRAEEAGSLEGSVAPAGGRRAWVWLAALGGACGLLFLGEYSAGVLALVAAGRAAYRFRGWRRAAAAGLVLGGFAVVAGPWVVRNLALTGSPVGLAVANVALKAGDSTAEPATLRATLSAELPRIDLNKLGNKALTAVQENFKSRFWSGGALWLSAFFVAGCLYRFKSDTVNTMRWMFALSMGALLASQAALNSGESERLAAVWLSPGVMVFGAGFFFVLLSSHAVLSRMPLVAGGVLIVLQALPLAHDMLEPRRLHFQYPPYFPQLFQGMRSELDRRGASGKYGLMADVPAGFAWYSGARVWAQPAKLRDFYAVVVEQPVGELVLTPRTLDRPFFSDLNARERIPASLSPYSSRIGEWGEVYAGLLTGTFPREFPLAVRDKLTENLYVLLNPALPPVAGKQLILQATGK